MAGRKRAVPKEVIHQIFDETVFSIVKGDKIVSEKEGIDIYKQIQSDERINFAMTTKAIYTEALKWFKSKNLEACASSSKLEDIDDKFKEISFEASESSESHVGSDDEFFETRSSEVVFTVSLSYEVWETIQPIPKECIRNDKSHKTHLRTYYVLQPGVWTNVLSERICRHPKKIICTWSFKRCKVHMNSSVKFITISGKCTTCDATLMGYVEKEPKESENVQFCFKMFGFDEKKHAEGRRNVRIGGTKAKELFTSKKSSSVLRAELINQSDAQMFEQPIDRDVSANAIRCGQYRQRQSKKLSNDPMQALEYLKESNAYSAIIHMISLSPASVIYGSPNQFKLYDA